MKSVSGNSKVSALVKMVSVVYLLSLVHLIPLLSVESHRPFQVFRHIRSFLFPFLGGYKDR